MPEDAEDKPTCFMAMPITTHEHEAKKYDDAQHWEHVMQVLFEPAIAQAGFVAVRPVSKGSEMIHSAIVTHLEKSDMVLCDLSGQNPNVFFELGVRTSLDKPVALVYDFEMGSLPFDTSGIYTHSYRPDLKGWDTIQQVTSLAQHLSDAYESCQGRNPLWRQFGLTQRAEEPHVSASPMEAEIALMSQTVDRLRYTVQDIQNQASPADYYDGRRHEGRSTAGRGYSDADASRRLRFEIAEILERIDIKPLELRLDGPDVLTVMLPPSVSSSQYEMATEAIRNRIPHSRANILVKVATTVTSNMGNASSVFAGDRGELPTRGDEVDHQRYGRGTVKKEYHPENAVSVEFENGEEMLISVDDLTFPR